MFNLIFSFSVKNRAHIILVFKILYLFLIGFLIIGGWSIYKADENAVNFYTTAIDLGRTALVVYILTTVPGITRRFGIQHRLIQVIRIFRRYLGITMYLLVLIHYMFVRGINLFFHKIFIFPPPLFEVFGTTAFFFLFFMFVTSNDVSVKRLGKWWQRIHNLTYIIVWLIFLHTALQRISIWSVMIGITAILQVLSHLFVKLKKPQSSTITS